MRPVIPNSPWIVVSLGFLIWSLGFFAATTADASGQNLLVSGDQGEVAPLALEIGTANSAPRFTRWSQTVNLAEAGWYRIRVEARTETPRAEAIIEVKGPHGSAFVPERSADWTAIDAYFRIVNLNEPVRISCGVIGARGGRAFFRELALNRIFGAPPRGSLVLDIDEEFYALPARVNSQLAIPPDSERAALRGVELAKPPSDESLPSELLHFRVVMAMLLAFGAITLLDWHYGPDRALYKSAGVAALLCLCLVATWLVTHIEYLPGHGFYEVEPRAVAGDEPHYLVMINGLLLRRDFRLQTVYDDVDRGGPEAGVMARGSKLDRHTIVINRRTGHRAPGRVEGDNGGLWHRNPHREFAPSPNVYEISVHPPGFPILIAAMVALMRPRAAEVEPDVGFVLMLIAWLGVVATYFVGRQVAMPRRWALLASAILFAASPWLPYSRAYFAESTIGTALILGLWAMMSELPILAGLAAAASALMKPPFALVGAGFFIEEVRARRWKGALKIAAVLALGLPAMAVVGRNFGLHRRFSVMGQLINTLFNPAAGLLFYAPWTIFGFVACVRALAPSSAHARLVRTMAIPLFLYLIAVSSIGLGAGYSYGPRYWVAFMPWLALAAVEAMRHAGRYQRAVCALLVLCGVAMAIPGALRYPQLFNRPALDAWRGFH